jgi:hypothetical protein
MPPGDFDLAQQVVIGIASIEETGELVVRCLAFQFDSFKS